MSDEELLAERFEAHRGHLRAVVYRMLGSLSEAEDAVQETWLKAARADTSGVENLAGWLTTVVSRVCLDMLRSRVSRREDPLEAAEPKVRIFRRVDPAEETLLADSVGLALLVVLDTLSPAERLAFVLHDLFAVPFADIAPIVERSPETTQRLTSRARQRVRGKSNVDDSDRLRRHHAVEAFMQASRNGDFEALLSLLDPNVAYSPDEAARVLGAGTDFFGAQEVAARFCEAPAQFVDSIWLDGQAGVVLAPRGRLRLVFTMTFAGDRIIEINAVADKARLSKMELTVPERHRRG